MKITISEIPEEGIELDLAETILSDEIRILSPLHAVLRIDRQTSELLVRGVVDGSVELQCSRCLKAFSADIRAAMDIVYHPAEELKKEEHRELKGEELDTGFYKDDTLDTVDLLQEQLFLNIPMKPLCSSGCKGLCTACGADLNIDQCNCEISETDPRLAVLKKLLNKKE